jgi:preprotein translocase subunit YajC
MDVILALTAVIAAFYFILLRPVINQQRRQRRDISSLEVGDEVLTTGGIFATVTDIATQDDGPTLLTLEIAAGVEVRATASAIEQVTSRASENGGAVELSAGDEQESA